MRDGGLINPRISFNAFQSTWFYLFGFMMTRLKIFFCLRTIPCRMSTVFINTLTTNHF